MRLSADDSKCKLAIVVDGINALFFEETKICKDWESSSGRKNISFKTRQRLCKTQEISVMKALKKAVSEPGKNTLVFATVDKSDIIKTDDPILVTDWWDK